MMLEILDENFKKAVRENIEKVIERDIKQDIHNMIQSIADSMAKPTEEKLIKTVNKRIDQIDCYDRNFLKEEIIKAVHNNIDKIITEEIIIKAVTNQVDKTLSTYLPPIVTALFLHDKDIENIIRQRIDEKVALIFAERFFKNNQ